jgi:protein gp37
VRFLSCEPLLGPVELKGPGCAACWREGVVGAYPSHPCPHCFGVGWVIVGHESGSGRRPGSEADTRAIVEQCRSAGVACFNKQMQINGRVSHDPDEWPADLRVREFPEAAP